VPLRQRVTVVRVVKLVDRRGKPAEARELYEELTAE
jgi:ribosomal 50S subunit-recycling heat shock protein